MSSSTLITLQAVSSSSSGSLSSSLSFASSCSCSLSSLPCSASPELLPSGLVLSSPGGWKVEKEDRGEYGGGEHGTGEDEGCAGGHAGIEFVMFMAIL